MLSRILKGVLPLPREVSVFGRHTPLCAKVDNVVPYITSSLGPGLRVNVQRSQGYFKIISKPRTQIIFIKCRLQSFIRSPMHFPVN
jgi:hypothetical protein